MGSYGRVFEVNWFWAPYVLRLHTMWSITMPILLTELLFPRLQGRPWLGRVGLSIDAVIFILICLVLLQRFTLFTHFSASPIELICTALLVALLISLALFVVPSLPAASSSRKVPAPWLVGLMAFLAAIFFSGMFLFFPNIHAVPALLPILLYAALCVAVVILVQHWSKQSVWSTRHLLALVSGALIETMIFGFLLVARGSSADLIFHAVLCVVFLGLLAWIGRRLRATEASNVAQSL